MYFLFMTDECVCVRKVYEGIGTSLTEQNIKDITVAITGVREMIVE